ncbi:hypothetical protein PM085_19125 [Halorubrum ezzemoulense]|uniref:Transmembrane protein n=1 Tax=Halorubrum ezzemoulense TaxID=337243 RepID=A0ABT4Z8Q1_HALEZ|nr:hypothetical protein [Halorubrum ezzemoulense]MDB2294327.1 hypothetical protein [Halorubrum ezzemoulense]
MDRAAVLVAVGSVLLIAGLLMPTVLISESRECMELNPPSESPPACEEYVTNDEVSPNQFRFPTILTGFVVGVVGVSLWGLDISGD